MVGATAASLTGCGSISCRGSFASKGLQTEGRKLASSQQETTQSIEFTLSNLQHVDIRSSQKSTQKTVELLKSLKLPTIRSVVKKEAEQKVKVSSELQDQEDDDQKASIPFYAAISNQFCDALESALLWALYGSTKPTNEYMLGNYAAVQECAPQRVLSVKGCLPQCLNGMYIQMGPNPKVMPVAKHAWLDGDGMLHGLRIKDGEATYACRYVRTSRLKQEEYWGAPKFWRMGDTVGFGGVLCMGIYALRQILGVLDACKGFGTANTSVAYHNGTLLALHELDMPYAVQILDDGDFKTISRHDFDKKLDHPFTAHPKIDPDTGEMFSYGYSLQGPPYITYNVISRDGVMSNPVTISLTGPKLVHDLAITPDYVIFMDCPLRIDPRGMVMKDQMAVAHSKTTPFRLGLLPKYAKDETEIRWFDFPSAINFHVANGWQEGDEIVLVTCRLPTVDMLRLDDACPRLHEYRINLKTGETSEKMLGEFDADFPGINKNYIGKKNRYVYTLTREAAVDKNSRRLGIDKKSSRFGIIKYDLTKEPELGKETLQIGGNVQGFFWHGDLRCALEPLFVPRSPGTDSDEDDGYILCHVFDENTWKSEVLVIDAKTMSPDPVAVIEMPSRVPYGIHTLFVSEEQLRSQLRTSTS